MIRQDQTTGLSFTEVTVSDGTLQVFSGFSREPGSATSLTSTNRRIAILNEFRRHRGGVAKDCQPYEPLRWMLALFWAEKKKPCKKRIQIKKDAVSDRNTSPDALKHLLYVLFPTVICWELALNSRTIMEANASFPSSNSPCILCWVAASLPPAC